MQHCATFGKREQVDRRRQQLEIPNLSTIFTILPRLVDASCPHCETGAARVPRHDALSGLTLITMFIAERRIISERPALNSGTRVRVLGVTMPASTASVTRFMIIKIREPFKRLFCSLPWQ